MEPPVTRTSPLRSIVAVGYQRPAFISGPSVHELPLKYSVCCAP
jgi:hypothetical protein